MNNANKQYFSQKKTKNIFTFCKSKELKLMINV